MPPYNGSGSFTPYVPGNPVVTGTVISSTAYNATQQDVAAGLSNAVTRDGQSPLTANLPAAGRKITGLGPGVVAGDSVRFEQLPSPTNQIPTAALADASVTTAKLAPTIAPVVTSINGGQLAGFRNLLINGNLAVNQRAYVSGAAVGAANTYTLDRWRVVVSGQSLVFSASGNGNQITAPAGGVEQVIEGANIGGGTYVLNWAGTATATVNGTPRVKGESFTLSAGTNATVRLIGGTASLVQLEPGTVPTPFEHRPIGAELALCQRYFEAGESALYVSTTSGGQYSNYNAYKTTKRTPPTVSAISTVATGFPTTITIQNNGAGGFAEYRVANATRLDGGFSSNWTASSEL